MKIPSIKEYKILDLGCGKKKYPNSFGVDFVASEGVNFVWDLNKLLPDEFNNHFEKVVNTCVLDHIGNPYLFLEGCYKYLKKGGVLEIVIDNADYWRYHFNLGNYHSNVWEKDCEDTKTHHKMMFQMKHITKMLEIMGFKIISTEYFRDYKGIFKGHIDYVLPKRLGYNMMKVVAQKS